MPPRNPSKHSSPFGARRKDKSPLPMVVGAGLSAMVLFMAMALGDAPSRTHEKGAMQQMGLSFDVDVPVSGPHSTILKIGAATDGKPNSCLLFTDIDDAPKSWSSFPLFPNRSLNSATSHALDKGPHTLTYTLQCKSPKGHMLKGTDHYPKGFTLIVRSDDLNEDIFRSTLHLRKDAKTYVPEG